MPAYTVHRPSVLRGGRLGVRAVAVVALLVAAATAFVFVTRAVGAHSTPSATRSSHALVKTHAAKGSLARAHAAAEAKLKAKAHVAKTAQHARIVKKKAAMAAIPAPAHTPVAVLNGGTAQGAAAATASRLHALGYPVPLVGNAGSRNLPSAIEYAQGFGPAARALARRIGPVSYVTPFDGPVQNLSGARLLVIIGS
ncbi:MAG: LytR C-terminal domain-containing protein [Gaiellales bacterium]